MHSVIAFCLFWATVQLQEFVFTLEGRSVICQKRVVVVTGKWFGFLFLSFDLFMFVTLEFSVACLHLFSIKFGLLFNYIILLCLSASRVFPLLFPCLSF